MDKPTRIFLTYVLLMLLSCALVKGQYQPAEELDSLFADVQLSGIFDDSKTFADAIPLYPSDTILHRYHRHKSTQGFRLDSFVVQHFRVPSSPGVDVKDPVSQGIHKNIDQLWYDLRRVDTSLETGSKISLPNPYIVPGGRFREIYYWDTYFTMLGLRISGQTEMIQHMVDNFAWLIDRYGFVPNGNRSYYLSRSQPPYFALMVTLLADIKGDTVLSYYYPQIQKEYAFWMEGKGVLGEQRIYKRVVRLNDTVVLNRYWDDEMVPRAESFAEDWELFHQQADGDSNLFRNIRAACESGWDFSARWLEDQHSMASIRTTEIIPVDLNALLYYYELILSECAKFRNDSGQAEQYTRLAVCRKEAILAFCWDSTAQFFVDYDFVKEAPIHQVTLAGMYPLFFNIATGPQAEKIAGKTKDFLLYDGGLITSLALSKQQWDAPNGWAPLQYISVMGLENYGFSELATEIANRWLMTVEMTYASDGRIMEKYNVINPDIEGGGGEYPAQDGFGWTNGVYLYLEEHFRE